jgi:hypothetical protein
MPPAPDPAPAATAAAAAAAAAAPADGKACANCGARLAGAYCSACGQRAHEHVLSLREFLGEAAEALTHADSRFWRTFTPLLFRPGFLTQQFIAGRRVRFLPPFRLYLVLSVVFFLLVPLTAHAPDGEAAVDIRAELQREIEASTDPDVKPLLQSQLRQLDALGARLAPGATDDASYCRTLPGMDSVPGWMRPRLVSACGKARSDNGRELGHSLVHNLGRAMFVLLPLLALVMTLMYRRQKRLYVEHLLLLLHNHAFAFLSLSLLMVATRFLVSDAWVGTLGVVLANYSAWYLYLSMRRVYGQGWIVTLVKFGLLTSVYICCAALMFVLATLYSAVTL